MRGGRTTSRVIKEQQPVRDARLAATTQVPAPYGGWNARGNLANMPPLEAVVLDNLFPGVQEVSLRKGMVGFKTDFPLPVHSLLVYNGPTGSKLFASTDEAIYDATASGSLYPDTESLDLDFLDESYSYRTLDPFFQVACTSGWWQYVNFSTAGGSFLLAVNGSDDLLLYNGSSWTSVTASSSPAITGIATSSLVGVSLHKKRVWFIEKDSMNLWYLPVESIAGAAVKFPIGSLFRSGGKVLAIGSWTFDGGNGPDDYFVVVTSNGEIAVYQGTDPSSADAWALVGVYEAGIPVGRKPLTDFGGDLLYLSRNGLFPLSKLLQSTIIDRSTAFSYKIDGAFLDAATTYSANNGWEMLPYRSGNFLIVNIPVSNGAVSYQYVMNTITGAWCRFTGWNASCWARVGSDLYFGGPDAVYQAWVGTNDDGTAITATWAQAYNSLGFKGQKQISMVRPNFSLAGNATLLMSLDQDFQTFDGQTQITYIDNSPASLWDSAIWDTSLWPMGVAAVEPQWLTIPNNLGYMHSFRGQLTTSEASFAWTSLNYAIQPAGVL